MLAGRRGAKKQGFNRNFLVKIQTVHINRFCAFFCSGVLVEHEVARAKVVVDMQKWNGEVEERLENTEAVYQTAKLRLHDGSGDVDGADNISECDCWCWSGD